MKYKSKIDWWFHLTVFVFIFFTFYFIYSTIEGKSSFALLSILSLAFLSLFLLPDYLSTYYYFDKEALIIKSGLFTKIVIPYSTISSCEAGTMHATTAALSKDKLIISYFSPKGKKYVVVSPKNKFDFMTQIKICTKKQ
ncbi:MAG: PH domain-containing protein [Clostridiales bacterium]|nr:PH domain-containing protein [Clostridiales bacterium]